MASEQDADRAGADGASAGRGDDGQDYVDRSVIDFDPDDGLYTGTAVDGSTDIPGPHEREPSGGGSAAEREQPPDEQQSGAGQDG